MQQLFIGVLNCSVTGAVVALLLLGLRVVLRRKLAFVFYRLLWATVFFRFFVPFSVPSVFSVFQVFGESAADAVGHHLVSVEFVSPERGVLLSPAAPGIPWEKIGTLWFAMTAVLLILGVGSYLRLLLRSRTAFFIRTNRALARVSSMVPLRRKITVWTSAMTDTPIVIGIFCPKIILPSTLDLADEELLSNILLHEFVHIRRLDALWMILFFVAAAIHWFNPLVWLCRWIAIQDLENACDEAALSLLNKQERLNYARSLVGFAHTRRYHGTAFTGGNLQTRVMGAIQYRPLTKIQTFGAAILVLAVGITVSTNPVLSPLARAKPQAKTVSDEAYQAFEGAALQLAQALQEGNGKFLALSTDNDPYFLPLYQELEPLEVTAYWLYPQSETVAYCYLSMANAHSFTATFHRDSNAVKLARLQPANLFDMARAVKVSEPVRFVQNLHRFGLVEGFDRPDCLPSSLVAALCIDEVHRDQQLSPEERLVPAAWVEKEARENFGFEQFSYLYDQTLFDPVSGCYLYDPMRSAPVESEIIAVTENGNDFLVTTNIYSDPLHLILEKTITYRLQKKPNR